MQKQVAEKLPQGHTQPSGHPSKAFRAPFQTNICATPHSPCVVCTTEVDDLQNNNSKKKQEGIEEDDVETEEEEEETEEDKT
jgi:hypothetical protein